ncbi:MAG: O-acetyl-ADP-ribose deacetylase [Chloroflexi bacterium]|nr:O-acetyl-ADP-ribose deacetylase [Chloroflexota bacterium]
MRELKIQNRTLCLIQGDITKLAVDAIVNAANESLVPGGGVSGAIHRAGGPSIWEECRGLGGCFTGDAKITNAGNLPAKRVIHTVGPVWQGAENREPELLASAYRSSLKVAADNGLRSVAFPSISTGIYGYPIEPAARIALGTVAEHLRSNDLPEVITFVLFAARDLAIYEAALAELAQQS